MKKLNAFRPEPQDCWYSVGYSCEALQVVPGQLAVMMEECDVAFRRQVDGVGQIRGDDFLKLLDLRSQIHEEFSEAAEKIAAHQNN